MFIPDPTFFPTRIPDPIFSYPGSRIPDPNRNTGGVTLFGGSGRGSEELPLPRDEGLQQEDGLVIPHPGVHLPV